MYYVPYMTHDYTYQRCRVESTTVCLITATAHRPRYARRHPILHAAWAVDDFNTYMHARLMLAAFSQLECWHDPVSNGNQAVPECGNVWPRRICV